MGRFRRLIVVTPYLHCLRNSMSIRSCVFISYEGAPPSSVMKKVINAMKSGNIEVARKMPEERRNIVTIHK